MATPTWYIKNGEIQYSLKGVMISGNIYNVLKNTICIGKNVRKLGFLVSPWIVVENVRVIGRLS